MTEEQPPTGLPPGVKRLGLVVGAVYVVGFLFGDRLVSFYRDMPATAAVALLIAIVVALYFVAGSD